MFSSLRLTLSSPTKSFVYTATDETPIKIGRSLKCQFSIPLEDLSREHCLVETKGEELFITDLGSSNGVWIDRLRIPISEAFLVTPDSSIVLANMYKLKLERVDFDTCSDIKKESAPRGGKGEFRENMLKPVEASTISFQLDYPTKDGRRKKKKVEKPDATTPESGDKNNETVKMVVGFLVALGFVLYYYAKN
jgi:hypothetical protein